jgi:alkylhydroperoxidase family enzyme
LEIRAGGRVRMRTATPAQQSRWAATLPEDRRVAHLDLIDAEDAEGLLEEEYEAAVERAGKVFNIVRSMSVSPPTLRASMELYKTIMFGPSDLSRQDRELLTTVVSATNECYY